MRQFRYAPETSPAEQEQPRHAGGLTSQERLGNGALVGHAGLEGPAGEAIQDDEIGMWMGTEDADTDMGPPDTELMGATPLPLDEGGGLGPPPSAEDITGPLEGPSGQIEAVHAEAGALQGAMSAMPSWDGGGEMGGFGEFSGLEQFGLGVTSVADQADAQVQKYKTVEEELIANMVLGMSIDEKQSTLSQMGYSSQSIGQMSASMMDQALMGTLTSQVRFLRIQGMSPDELRHLSIGDQRQFLTDLGVPAKDLRKAKDRYIRSAVSDVVAKSKVPGRHTVRLKIKGGFFRKKSYNIQLDVNDEGHLAGVDIKKKGGFFSKLGGFIKMALPFIAKLLAGVTGGLSLVALGIYNAVQAARQGNWLGAIAAAAGGMAGASLGMVAKVADKVAQIAQSTQAGLLAIKAKSPGGLLAAISSGAGAVAGFAADQASKFATTLKGWSDKLATAGNIATGTEATVAAIRGKDPLAAVSGALQVMGSVAEAKTPGSSKGGHLERAQSVSRHVRLARSAIGSKPPQYGLLADAVLKMAGEFNSSGKIDSAGRLARTGQALHNAVISGDPSLIANAVVDVAEAIELANGGEDGLEADRRTAVGDKYRKTRAVVRPSMGVVEGLRSGDWESALKSSAVLVETLNEKGLAGSAATVARLSLAMKGAILSGDAERMYNAAAALGSAVQHVWVEVRTKEEEEAQAPVPLEVLPSTPINIEMGLVVTLPSRPIKLAATSLPSATSSSSSAAAWEYGCGDEGFEPTPAPPVHRAAPSKVSLGPVARLFQRICNTENPALDDVSIDRDQLRDYLEDDLQFAQGEWFRGKKLNGAVESLMEQLDLNGDGRVSWAEFQAITDQLAAVLVPGSVAKFTGAETIQAATEYFDSIPGASDGSISFEDLKQVAHDSLPEFTDHRGLVAQLIARLAIDTIDSNQRALEVEDRTISREEWIQAVIEIVNGGQ